MPDQYRGAPRWPSAAPWRSSHNMLHNEQRLFLFRTGGFTGGFLIHEDLFFHEFACVGSPDNQCCSPGTQMFKCDKYIRSYSKKQRSTKCICIEVQAGGHSITNKRHHVECTFISTTKLTAYRFFLNPLMLNSVWIDSVDGSQQN